MGMFDEISCDMALPERPAWANGFFQTKDLACMLEKYHITADGFLEDENKKIVDFTGGLEFHEYDSELRERVSYTALVRRGHVLALVRS